MNLVDSSAWLAFFANEENADIFAEPLKSPSELVVPTVVIYEVFKVLLRESGDDAALAAFAAMSRGRVVDISPRLAVEAARVSLQYGLPMADSMILAIARSTDAIVWTQDADFNDIPGVKCFPKRSKGTQRN